jgi:hypothetical protein
VNAAQVPLEARVLVGSALWVLARVIEFLRKLSLIRPRTAALGE